jgi:hypothetical protein
MSCPRCKKPVSTKPSTKSEPVEPEPPKPKPVKVVRPIPKCNLCGGKMVKTTISTGNVMGIVIALLVLIVGLYITFSALFCGGPLIGIPLCILALFMGGNRKNILKCQNCGAAVDRVGQQNFSGRLVIGFALIALSVVIFISITSDDENESQSSKKVEMPRMREKVNIVPSRVSDITFEDADTMLNHEVVTQLELQDNVFNIIDFQLRWDESWITILGEVENIGSIPKGVKLQAVARDKDHRVVAVKEFWPASINNIASGQIYPFEYPMRRLEEIEYVDLGIINVRQW